MKRTKHLDKASCLHLPSKSLTSLKCTSASKSLMEWLASYILKLLLLKQITKQFTTVQHKITRRRLSTNLKSATICLHSSKSLIEWLTVSGDDVYALDTYNKTGYTQHVISKGKIHEAPSTHLHSKLLMV